MNSSRVTNVELTAGNKQSIQRQSFIAFLEAGHVGNNTRTYIFYKSPP